MTKAAIAIPWLSAVKTTSMWPIYFTRKNIMLQSPTFLDCFRTLQNLTTSIRYASAASDIVTLKKAMLATNSFAPETTSCQWSMCFLLKARNRRKSNLINKSIVLKHRELLMRISSLSLYCPVAKYNNPPTPSKTKCAQQLLSLLRALITCTDRP